VIATTEAAALREQLAAAQAQAQAAAAETTTLQQLLDSERAAAEERRQLEAARKAERATLTEQYASVDAAWRQAARDAKAARTELEILRAQVHLAGHRLPGLCYAQQRRVHR
jgi:uncharacterized protein involved in exopolysaccharide biosynthesis